MRLRYKKLLRRELATAGTSKEEIDDELRYLLRVLAAG